MDNEPKKPVDQKQDKQGKKTKQRKTDKKPAEDSKGPDWHTRPLALTLSSRVKSPSLPVPDGDGRPCTSESLPSSSNGTANGRNKTLGNRTPNKEKFAESPGMSNCNISQLELPLSTRVESPSSPVSGNSLPRASGTGHRWSRGKANGRKKFRGNWTPDKEKFAESPGRPNCNMRPLGSPPSIRIESPSVPFPDDACLPTASGTCLPSLRGNARERAMSFTYRTRSSEGNAGSSNSEARSIVMGADVAMSTPVHSPPPNLGYCYLVAGHWQGFDTPSPGWSENVTPAKASGRSELDTSMSEHQPRIVHELLSLLESDDDNFDIASETRPCLSIENYGFSSSQARPRMGVAASPTPVYSLLPKSEHWGPVVRHSQGLHTPSPGTSQIMTSAEAFGRSDRDTGMLWLESNDDNFHCASEIRPRLSVENYRLSSSQARPLIKGVASSPTPVVDVQRLDTPSPGIVPTSYIGDSETEDLGSIECLENELEKNWSRIVGHERKSESSSEEPRENPNRAIEKLDCCSPVKDYVTNPLKLMRLPTYNEPQDV